MARSIDSSWKSLANSPAGLRGSAPCTFFCRASKRSGVHALGGDGGDGVGREGEVERAVLVPKKPPVVNAFDSSESPTTFEALAEC